jgi:hypothetical protein
MTATPPPWSAPTAAPRRSWGPGRVVALVLGVLLLLPGLALLGAGGALLWADWTNRSDGIVVSPDETFSTEGYALVSERIDLQTDADWVPVSSALGTARVDVTGPGSEAVFVGIAPVDDVTGYLGDVQRTVIDDLGFDGPATAADERSGGAPSGPPADQDFWTASVSGSGTQQLTWEPAEGDWMLVVMNADASAGLQVEARVGAEFPALGGIGWGVVAAGAVLTAIAVVLLVVAARTPRDQRPPAYPQGYVVPSPRGPAAPEYRTPETTAGSGGGAPGRDIPGAEPETRRP